MYVIGVTPQDLVLWKLKDSLPLEPISTIGRRLRLLGDLENCSDYTVELSAVPKVSHVFPGAPDDILHLLIELSPIGLRTASAASTLTGPTNELLKLRKAYNENIPDMPPSVLASPSTFASLQRSSSQKIWWSRPHSCTGRIPVTLLRPVFGQFIGDCDNHQPTREDNMLTYTVSSAMSNFFHSGDEDERAEACRKLLEDEYDLRLSTMPIDGSEFRDDGHLQVNGHRYLILEGREEITSIGCGSSAEPYAEAILNYRRAIKAGSEKYPEFNFPCTVITIFGAHIVFSGAAWTDRPNFEVLSPVLPLFWHGTNTRLRAMAARHFGALKKAIATLQGCYRSLHSPSDVTPQLHYPYPRQYRCLEMAASRNFTYCSQIDETKLVFKAKTDQGDMVCVKFVQSYSKDAHYMFARIGCAPKLRGFEILAGGWKMVVMDFISGNRYTLLFGSHVRREIVVDLLENKLRSVHDAGFVHRDVRSANIMVKTNSDDDLAPILLDFDWSGKIGEVRYPMNVYNGKSLWRPASAVDSKPILPEHDIDILHRLLPIRPETPVTSLAHIHPSGSGDDLMLQLPAISQRASPGNLKHAMEDDVNGMALDCPATCLNGHTVDGQSDTDFAQRCIRLAAHCISFANVSLRSESFSPLY